MPATEQTWRDSKLLHVIFGISALIMMVVTIWMLAADHSREWKGYQRQFRQVEARTAQARINAQENAEYEAQKVELSEALAAAQTEAPPQELVDQFVEEAQSLAEKNSYDVDAVREAYDALLKEKQKGGDAGEVVEKRQTLVASMNDVIQRARLLDDNAQRELKFKRAELDQFRGDYFIAIDNSAPASELAAKKKEMEAAAALVDDLAVTAQDASTHRKELERLRDEMIEPVATAEKRLADLDVELDRLKAARSEQEIGGLERLLELPILDAFQGPLKPDQIWLPQLTLNNNFRDVARFDRCTTCHQGIVKSAPGSATAPGFQPLHEVVVELATPEQEPEPADENTGLTTAQLYGFTLASQGLLNASDVTIESVRPRSPAAIAGLEAGDVLRWIGDARVLSRDRAELNLIRVTDWGQPLTLGVERGVPEPFSTHPRLDLFLGSLSPHPIGEFGCTICHEGQGSATSFKWASHTPNTPKEAREWSREHGWFNNHHWILPMRPDRFEQSSCLKCHHNVQELAASDRFPEPPAGKLVEGFRLIEEYGCFGCHEINGYKGPGMRQGPDMRTEPNYFAAAAQLLHDPALAKQGELDETLAQIKRLAEQVIEQPEIAATRKRLAELVKADQQRQLDAEAEQPAQLSGESHALVSILGADDEQPGEYRRVGPSLRHVASKVDRQFLYNWIDNPTNFRPTTKMPRFFGLWDHLLPEPKLDDEGQIVTDEHGNEVTHNPGLEESQRLEPVEVRAVTEYLLDASQPYAYLDRPQQVTAEPSAERGKLMFQTRGCLACHQHPDFPDAKDTQGPNLANLGSKFTGQNGARWLYSWLREPNAYHTRTFMPNVFLEPITEADGEVTDPAADITTYLLSQKGWKPGAVPEVNDEALDELARLYLEASFTKSQVNRYLKEGIPQSMAAELVGDEKVLVSDGELTERQKLLYVGRRTISRLGCSGCHDIPGFESAKSIGTGLADWGRKQPSTLAFEQILQFLARTEDDPHAAHLTPGEHAHLDTRDMDPDKGFFIEALQNHEREGFIWQKLRDPRSYDYMKTQSKPYTDRLRMPEFSFTDEQREEIITFVLGLVAEPPAAQYVYQASPRQQAVLEGEALLTKFNCVGCHTMKMERWDFDYLPFDPENAGAVGMLFPAPPFDDYPFLKPHFTPQELEASKQLDQRGYAHARIHGRPNTTVAEDDEGNPLYFFELWEPAALGGEVWAVGGTEVPISGPLVTKRWPEVGGSFARLLHPVALELERKANPNAKESDAWGWVPPPLLGEGEKVQTQWLHDFLLDPHPIRPAVILRMPKFNMSSEEASKLVDYFAAADNVEYPYEYDPRTRGSYLAALEQQHPDRLADALKIVTDNNFCVKCHLVGDFVPQGSAAALAPNLDDVHARIRPDFLERWLANPKRELPYTGMPVNFPRDKPASQELFEGTAEEQLQAVVDLLLNFHIFMQDQTSIAPMVKPPEPTEEAEAAQ